MERVICTVKALRERCMVVSYIRDLEFEATSYAKLQEVIKEQIGPKWWIHDYTVIA